MTVTLDASAKRRNVVSSWHAYVVSALGGTFPPDAIDLGQASFAEAAVAEWIEPRLLSAETDYGRRVAPSTVAQKVVYMPQVNIYLKPRGVDGSTPVNLYRMEELRDAVAAALKSGVVIPVVGASDGAAVGVLIVRRTTLDDEISGARGQAPEDLRQHSYGVEADWIETYQP